MKTIKLTNSDKCAIVSDCDFDHVNKYRWFLKNTRGNEYYVARSYRDGKKVKTMYLHRFIMNCPDDLQVDHKDMNRLNNTRENLECVSNAENNSRRYDDIPF